MNTTQTASHVILNGANLTLGMRVVHPRTGRTVELLDELSPERDEMRRFFVAGTRGGYDALVIGETTAIEVVA